MAYMKTPFIDDRTAIERLIDYRLNFAYKDVAPGALADAIIELHRRLLDVEARQKAEDEREPS